MVAGVLKQLKHLALALAKSWIALISLIFTICDFCLDFQDLRTCL
jgi:hypothetical protein